MLRVSCNFVADGAKTEPKAEDLLEVEPLVSRVEERLKSLKSLPIFGLEKGQKYSLFMALRLTLWNEPLEKEKKTEKSNREKHKKIEHGGEISYHARCCVFEVLENYRKRRG